MICLGDIVGYGSNPRECVDYAMRFELCVLGNHDQGADQTGPFTITITDHEVQAMVVVLVKAISYLP